MDLPADYGSQLLAQALRMALVAAGLLAFFYASRRYWSAERVAAIFRWVFLGLVYVFVAALVLGGFMERWGFRGDNRAFGFERMLDHSAERPYVYRVLSPAIINAGAALLPDALVSGNEGWWQRGTPLRRFRKPGESWTLEKSVKWHVAYFYLFACLIGALLAARHLARVVCRAPPLFADFAPAVAALFLPLVFHLGAYLYDFPELLLMLLCLVALAHARSGWFYLLFLAAILNKESNVLLVVFFVAFQWDRLPWRRLLGHVAVQVAIGAMLLVSLRVLFSENGGATAFFSFPVNLVFWLTPSSYVTFFDSHAPLVPLPRGLNVVTLFTAGMLLFWAWDEKPREVRRLVVLSALVNLPLFLLFAALDELRNLSLMFPALYLAGCGTVLRVYRSAGARGRSLSC